MTHSIFTLDPNYSTTRLVSTIKPQIEDHPEAKFKTHLFLPEGEGRQGEGGLRTKGYFKHSYEVIDGQWYITDNFGVREEDAQRIPVDQDQVPDELLEYVQKELRQADEDSDMKESEPPYSPEHIKLPLITVVTVVFNGEKYLAETIESVVSQEYPNVEYIIIDGCSTDNTLGIVKKYEEKIDYWVSEKDVGLYDAMNKGIALSLGELIGILNSDDTYYSRTFFHVYSYFCKNANRAVYYGDMYKYNNEIGKKIYFKGDLSYDSLLANRIKINHSTCVVHKSLYKNYNFFDIYFDFGADRDLMLRFMVNGVDFIYVNKILADFRFGGVTSNLTLAYINKSIKQEYFLEKKYYKKHVMVYNLLKQSFRLYRNLLIRGLLGSYYHGLQSFWLAYKHKK